MLALAESRELAPADKSITASPAFREQWILGILIPPPGGVQFGLKSRIPGYLINRREARVMPPATHSTKCACPMTG